MVGATGFEPATSRSQSERSTRLSYAPTATQFTIEMSARGFAENSSRHRAHRVIVDFPTRPTGPTRPTIPTSLTILTRPTYACRGSRRRRAAASFDNVRQVEKTDETFWGFGQNVPPVTLRLRFCAADEEE